MFDWGVVSIDEADDLEFLAVLGGAVSDTVGTGSVFLAGLSSLGALSSLGGLSSSGGLCCLAGVLPIPMPNAEASALATLPDKLDGASSPVEPF